MKGSECGYEYCPLPDNNKRYFWQFGYLLISLVVMYFKPEAFNFLAIILFVVPILLDLASLQFCGPVLKVIKWFFVGLNLIVFLFCFLGMAGCFVDNGIFYEIPKSAIYMSALSFEKRKIANMLMIDLIVPFVLAQGSPSKKHKQVRNIVMKIRL